MNNSLKKIIDLARKTGDRLIVTDSDGEDAIVVMNLDDYDKLLEKKDNLKSNSERRLLNEVNQDVSAWKARLEEEVINEAIENKQKDFSPQDFIKENEFMTESGLDHEDFEENSDIEDDERFYFEPVE